MFTREGFYSRIERRFRWRNITAFTWQGHDPEHSSHYEATKWSWNKSSGLLRKEIYVWPNRGGSTLQVWADLLVYLLLKYSLHRTGIPSLWRINRRCPRVLLSARQYIKAKSPINRCGNVKLNKKSNHQIRNRKSSSPNTRVSTAQNISIGRNFSSGYLWNFDRLSEFALVEFSQIKKTTEKFRSIDLFMKIIHNHYSMQSKMTTSLLYTQFVRPFVTLLHFRF